MTPQGVMDPDIFGYFMLLDGTKAVHETMIASLF